MDSFVYGYLVQKSEEPKRNFFVICRKVYIHRQIAILDIFYLLKSLVFTANLKYTTVNDEIANNDIKNVCLRNES